MRINWLIKNTEALVAAKKILVYYMLVGLFNACKKIEKIVERGEQRRHGKQRGRGWKRCVHDVDN